MRELIFATHNENKAIEIQAILENNYRILSLDQVGLSDEIPEDQDTLEGNALQKARGWLVLWKLKTFVFTDCRIGSFLSR